MSLALVAGAAVVLVIAALVASKKPTWVAFGWAALLPFQADTVAQLGFRAAPADLLLAGLVLGVCARKLAQRDLRPAMTRPVLWTLGLLAWFLVTLPQTYATLGTIPQAVLVNKILGLALLVASYWALLESLPSTRDVTRFLRWFCAVACVWNLAGLVGYGLEQWAGLKNLTVYGDVRLTGFLVDPNAYGGFLVAALAVQIALTAAGRRSWKRGLELSGILSLFVGVYLTYSRSAWLALAVGVCVLFWLAPRHEKKRVAGIAGLLAVELAVLVFFTQAEVATQATREVASRLDVVEQASRSLLHSPLWGIGLGVAPTLPGQNALIIHSTYFWLLAECGLIGLGLFAMLGLSVRRQFLTVRRAARPEVYAAAAALACGLAAWLGLMVGIEALYQRHFWLLAGVLGALGRAVPRAREGVPRVLQLAASDVTVASFLMPLVDRLRGAGYEVECACADGPRAAALRQEGYTVHRIHIARRLFSLLHAVAFVEMVRLMRRRAYDVVHAHTPIASALGRLAARQADVPVVLHTAHGFYFHDRMRRPLRRLIVWIERGLGRACTNHLFTVSCEDEATAIREAIIARDRVSCLRSVGIDLARFDVRTAPALDRASLGLADEDRVICFIGRLVEEKGILDLARAMPRILDRFPRAKLLVVGEALRSDRAGKTSRRLSRLLHEHGLEQAVRFLGTRNDVPRILSLSDVFVLPSYREGMPVTILEAMAAAKPVVATDVRGCREEVVDGVTGRLVPPASPCALADAVIWILEDRVRAEALGKAGRRRVESEFAEARVLDAQLAVYDRLVRGARREQP